MAKKKYSVIKAEDASEEMKKQFIEKLRNDDFTYLAGKPYTSEEIDKLEKKLSKKCD